MTRANFDAGLPARQHMPFMQGQRRAYESPIEELGAWFIRKPLDKNLTVLAVQVPILTPRGAYRGDLIVHTPGRNTLVEFDGADYHQDGERDAQRMEHILGSGLVDQVVRFPGTLIHHLPGDAAFVVACIHPEALNRIGAHVAQSLASAGVRAAWEQHRDAGRVEYTAVVEYAEDPEDNDVRPFWYSVHRAPGVRP